MAIAWAIYWQLTTAIGKNGVLIQGEAFLTCVAINFGFYLRNLGDVKLKCL